MDQDTTIGKGLLLLDDVEDGCRTILTELCQVSTSKKPLRQDPRTVEPLTSTREAMAVHSYGFPDFSEGQKRIRCRFCGGGPTIKTTHKYALLQDDQRCGDGSTICGKCLSSLRSPGDYCVRLRTTVHL